MTRCSAVLEQPNFYVVVVISYHLQYSWESPICCVWFLEYVRKTVNCNIFSRQCSWIENMSTEILTSNKSVQCLSWYWWKVSIYKCWGGKKKKSPEVIELIPELQITTNNWQLSQLNTEPCTLPYTILTMVLL